MTLIEITQDDYTEVVDLLFSADENDKNLGIRLSAQLAVRVRNNVLFHKEHVEHTNRILTDNFLSMQTDISPKYKYVYQKAKSALNTIAVLDKLLSQTVLLEKMCYEFAKPTLPDITKTRANVTLDMFVTMYNLYDSTVSAISKL